MYWIQNWIFLLHWPIDNINSSYLHENATKLVKSMTTSVLKAKARDCLQYNIFFSRSSSIFKSSSFFRSSSFWGHLHIWGYLNSCCLIHLWSCLHFLGWHVVTFIFPIINSGRFYNKNAPTQPPTNRVKFRARYLR